jgi:hypothetical protein
LDELRLICQRTVSVPPYVLVVQYGRAVEPEQIDTDPMKQFVTK